MKDNGKDKQQCINPGGRMKNYSKVNQHWQSAFNAALCSINENNYF